MKYRSTKEITLSVEMVDEITIANLREAYEYHKARLHDNEFNGLHMHPEDVEYYKKLLPAIQQVLDYFGEMV